MHLEKMNMLQTKVNFFHNCLKRDYVKSAIDLEAEYCLTDEPITFEEKNEHQFKSVKAGDIWGQSWQCAWFHLTGTIPAQWAGQPVCVRINIGGEGLLFSADGVPLRSITDYSVFQANFVNEYFPLCNTANGGEKVDLWVDAGANGYFGMLLNPHPRLDIREKEGNTAASVKSLQLCLTDETLRQLGLDWEIALSLLQIYPRTHYRHRQILTLLIEAIDLYQGKQENAGIVREFLKEKLFSKKSCDSALNVTAVGHAHIDTAWLWPIRETIRKCGRTFANQIANIEKFPEYVFGASQPQHYKFVKDHYPVLYQKIKKAVADGRWELQGGMWVEADCNLISAESMIRQFLHGKNFYMDEFGSEVRNLWLPDVFGYSGIMPQILKGCGCDYFLTQKISWNQFNKFPHTTFIWRGIDGSEVLTHFPPESDYNARMIPEQLANAQDNFKEADKLPEFLSLFGIGDGGGGPTEDHVERAMRLKNIEGCPKVTMGRADDFFERLKDCADKLEIWEGELYLEKHQGTLTTQAKIKKANRQLEYLLKQVEMIYSALPLKDYPAQELDGLWKKLLVNQFHDIIPGSSITRVYRETAQQHSEIFENCKALLNKAAAKLFTVNDHCITLFNPLSTTYSGIVTLPESWHGATLNGELLPGQQHNKLVEVAISIPAGSFIALEKSTEASPEVKQSNDLFLENNLICYKFNSDAQIISIFDKEANRELLAPQTTANVLSLYNDDPANYDAWDIDIGYEAQKLAEAQGEKAVKYTGPAKQSLEFELTIGNSKICQKIILKDDKRLDFDTTVQWDESHKMLRTCFPVNINSAEASFDLQYGFIKRSTTCNTSWDMARYEVAAHRYADISDSQYGMALLNNCKYGHKVHGRVLDLNLLRSPKYPDFTADQGEQTFTYALLPHNGTLVQSDVIAQAAVINQPPLIFNGFAPGRASLPCRMESDSISLEVIKKAEKEDCLIIRLAETKGETSQAVLHFDIPVKKLITTNLIEWTETDCIDISGNQTSITLKPFEIKTFKLQA